MSRKEERVAIDLFAGSGGLTLGMKDAGFRVLAAVELSQLASETYQMNHPEVQVWNNDIRVVNPQEIKTALRLRKRQVDLLAACPPCQGFSSIRTLNGSRKIDDDRNDLIHRVADYVETFLPKALMLENVPGLALDPRLLQFTNRISALGYTSSWQVLDASKFEVPQRRRRFILVASRSGMVRLPDPISKVVTVREIIGELPPPGESGDPLHDVPAQRSAKVQEIIKKIPRNGGSRGSLGETQLKCHATFDGFKDVYGRMSWDHVAPTITGGCINPSKGRFLHPEEDRAITLREAALLQTFPGDYAFSLKRGAYPVAEMIGNALPPKFIKAHAAAVLTHLNR